MKRILRSYFKYKSIALSILLLAGCANAQQYSGTQTSVSQIQGGCFSSREKFLDQADCIKTALSKQAINPYAQEYLAYLQLLSGKVRKGEIGGNEARLKLTQTLNKLKKRQDHEFQQQEMLDNQRTMQTYEILKQNAPKPLEPPYRRPVNTNCQVIGNQTHCTTY